MGQSASLYRIEKNGFQIIVENPDSFELSNISKGTETFEKTHEGLLFVLSKGLDKTNSELIHQIFYPSTFIGEEIDFENLDFENLDFENIPDDFDTFKQPIYYNDPNKVLEIFKIIDKVTIDDFQNQFNHKELNKEGIYPYNIWNNEKGENVAFNKRCLSFEFQKLKTIFKIATENNEYLLSYVG